MMTFTIMDNSCCLRNLNSIPFFITNHWLNPRVYCGLTFISLQWNQYYHNREQYIQTMLWNSFLLIYNYIRYFCCRRNLDNSVCDLAYVDREGEEQNCFFMAPFSPYQQKVSNDDWLTAEPAKCFLSSFSDLCYSRSTWRNWRLSQANCIFRSFREGRHWFTCFN